MPRTACALTRYAARERRAQQDDVQTDPLPSQRNGTEQGALAIRAGLPTLRGTDASQLGWPAARTALAAKPAEPFAWPWRDDAVRPPPERPPR
jgi:hypothetical protein